MNKSCCMQMIQLTKEEYRILYIENMEKLKNG